ncbi:hypothetical protein [Corynebacterium sp. UMB2355A]|uniref:hypothetical protein n=1 Tax=Corynebacterium sp. UMB2355A TaxID=3081222 RepID=UPI0029FF15D8|nr:hypothetical protein [Corynebacterium sp. UMB2355A]WPJ93935.1 hypothetical protein R0V12_11380 [Corynebacterium sp. UMB2355A]
MVVRCASPVRPGWNQEASRTAPTTSAGRLGGQREPVDEHGSGGGLVEPEEASHGRGLAGSVRA